MPERFIGHDPDKQRQILRGVLTEHPEWSRYRLARRLGLDKSYFSGWFAGKGGTYPLRLDIALEIERFFGELGIDQQMRDDWLVAALGAKRADAIRAASEPPPLAPPLLHELGLDDDDWVKAAFFYADHGDWPNVERVARAAAERMGTGSIPWAQTILRFCFHGRQQSGDIAGAEDYLALVESTFRGDPEHPDPLPAPIAALLNTQRGWILDQQYGAFVPALRCFTQARGMADEADDPLLAIESLHFIGRIRAEMARTTGQAWLGSRVDYHSGGKIPRDNLVALTALLDDPAWQHLPDDGNPHHYHRDFEIRALVQPGTALQVLSNHADQFAERGLGRLVTMAYARWSVSDEEWDTAERLATEAFDGYCAACFPQGIALAAAVRSYALLHQGLRTQRDATDCLDGWLVAMMLHWYPTHPLWQTAAIWLDRTKQIVEPEHSTWLRDYLATLRGRYFGHSGMFRAMGAIDQSFAAALRPFTALELFLADHWRIAGS